MIGTVQGSLAQRGRCLHKGGITVHSDEENPAEIALQTRIAMEEKRQV
ncbi:MAG: hypothetical protein ACI8WM_002942 [Burkholderiaceae bacterium]